MIEILKEISFWLTVIAVAFLVLSLLPVYVNKFGKKGDIFSRAFFIVACLFYLILNRFF